MSVSSYQWSAVTVLFFAALAPAQSVKLAEEVKPGDVFQYDLKLAVTGRMKLDRDGQVDSLALEAEATHRFTERVEAAEAGGAAGKVIRHYALAKSNSRVGTDRSSRELAADRRLIVANRTAAKTLHYSPGGAFTREELDLVGEHYDTMSLPTLLPGKELRIGETWAVSADAVQHACLFDGVLKHDLKGTLTKVDNGVAEFTITGAAEGTELGAKVTVAVTATGKFHIGSSRIVSLNWDQDDVRTRGPASPAMEVQAKVSLTRVACDEPTELNADVRAKLPAEGAMPALTRLRLTSQDGTYEMSYPREWVVVGQTRDHLMMRLIEKGEFVAQATIYAWRAAEPGKHATPGEFKDRLARLPQWEPERVTADQEIPLDGGRWAYRVAAVGKQDGTPVAQSFSLVAGLNGKQVGVTVMAAPDKAGRATEREEELVKSLQFPDKK